MFPSVKGAQLPGYEAFAWELNETAYKELGTRLDPWEVQSLLAAAGS